MSVVVAKPIRLFSSGQLRKLEARVLDSGPFSFLVVFFSIMLCNLVGFSFSRNLLIRSVFCRDLNILCSILGRFLVGVEKMLVVAERSVGAFWFVFLIDIYDFKCYVLL